ncbi:DNA-binding protein HEXBP-like [Haliotis rubra]|uniref:DNA-binding protein HEXBP-like n=1 Tax=Haliotis rubra TaxID=36100 RepID=UPI001EE6328A|nr:DNA-binding protein HEXBP-like [Haliotis rubra]
MCDAAPTTMLYCWKCPQKNDHVFKNCPLAVCGNKCGGQGHWGKDCPMPCTICQQSGHYRRTCPSFNMASSSSMITTPPSTPSTTATTPTPTATTTPSYDHCYRCGDSGHWAPQCPTASCYKCGGSGPHAPPVIMR